MSHSQAQQIHLSLRCSILTNWNHPCFRAHLTHRATLFQWYFHCVRCGFISAIHILICDCVAEWSFACRICAESTSSQFYLFWFETAIWWAHLLYVASQAVRETLWHWDHELTSKRAARCQGEPRVVRFLWRLGVSHQSQKLEPREANTRYHFIAPFQCSPRSDGQVYKYLFIQNSIPRPFYCATTLLFISKSAVVISLAIDFLTRKQSHRGRRWTVD